MWKGVHFQKINVFFTNIRCVYGKKNHIYVISEYRSNFVRSVFEINWHIE
jgi:hypothetical protein